MKYWKQSYVGGLRGTRRVEFNPTLGGEAGLDSSVGVTAQSTDHLLRAVREPISWTAEPYAGIADYEEAQTLVENVRGVVADAIRVIAQRISGLEMEVFFERAKDGDVELIPAPDHPLQKLLDNPTFHDGAITHSAMQTWSLVVTQLLSAGECYLLIVRDGINVPENLYVMKPGTTRPLIHDGRISGYETRTSMGKWIEMDTADVVRIWEPDPYNIYAARGVLSKHAQTFNLDKFVKEHWSVWFKNDATPKITLETDDPTELLPNPEDRDAFDESWFRRMHRRLGHKVGLPYMLKPGWHAKVLKSQEEAQNGVTMMKWTRDMLLQAFGVPPSKLGDVVDVNRAAAETNDYVFDRNTVEPISRLITEALTMQLATQYVDAEGVKLVVQYKPFIGIDKEFHLQRDTLDAQSKIRSVNEIREDRDSEHGDAPWGVFPIGSHADKPYTGEEVEDVSVDFNFPIRESQTVERSQMVAPKPNIESLRARFTIQREWDREQRRVERWANQFESRMRTIFNIQKAAILKRFDELSLFEPEKRDKQLPNEKEAIRLARLLFKARNFKDLYDKRLSPLRLRAYIDSGAEVMDQLNASTSFNLTREAVKMLNDQDLMLFDFTSEATMRKITGVISDSLTEGWSADETAVNLKDKLDGRLSLSDARRIARTEVGAATQAAQVEGYRQSGNTQGKVWLTSLDGDVRDAHRIHGQFRTLDAKFTLESSMSAGVEEADAPRDPVLSAGNRVNCRCYVIPILMGEDPTNVVGEAIEAQKKIMDSDVFTDA